MSALPRPNLTLTDPDPHDDQGCRGLSGAKAPNQTEWIPLARAAQILGLSEGHLRRVCTDELAPKGAAKQMRIESASKPVWHIHCSYDARLGREHVSSLDPSLGEVWLSASDAQREKAMTKASVLIAYRALVQDPRVEITRAFPSFRAAMQAEHGDCPTDRTLRRWSEQCPPSSSPIAVAAALIDARTRAAETTASEPAIDFFRGLYLTPAKMSVAQCHRMVEAKAAKEGWAWPSLRTVQLNIKKWIDPQMATMAREGQDTWRRKYQTPIHQDPDAFAAGECWEADHSPCDFFIRVPDGKGGWKADRASYTVWMDRRSRRIVGWHIGMSPNSESIRAALSMAFKSGMHIPAYAVMDNGKDFKSEAVAGLTKAQRRKMTKAERDEAQRAWGGMLGMLGIEAHFNIEYNKDGKGRVERLMRTIHEDFDRIFESYCGSDRVRVPEEHIKKILKNIMDLPTIEQARAKFVDWVEWYNHRDQHNIEDLTDADGRTKISPAAFYDAFIFRRSQLKDPKVLALLEVPWSRELKVSRHGVSMKIDGKTIHYGGACPAIKKMVGQSVRVSFDPSSMREITVWTTDLRFVAIAEMNSTHGGFRGDAISREALKSALRRQRDERKRIATPIDQLAITRDALEVAADEQRKLGRMREQSAEAERRGKRKIEDMPPVRLVTTSLDEQAEAAERAKRSRKVAGADFDSIPSAAEIYGDGFASTPAGPKLTDYDGFDDQGFEHGGFDDAPQAQPSDDDDFGYDPIDAIGFRPEGES